MTAWWPVPIAHHESASPLIIDPWTGKQAGNTWQCGWRRAKTWLAGQHWLAEGDSSSVAAGHLVPGAAVECPASCFGGESSDLLEEECDVLPGGAVAEVADPVQVECPVAGAVSRTNKRSCKTMDRW
jgi:hypothetical protein